MDEHAPGAAEAVRIISRGELSDKQRGRLARLTSDATKSAWLELAVRRQKTKRKLSKKKLLEAQHELMWEAYRAADFAPTGEKEIEQAERRLEEIATAATKLSHDVSKAGEDLQMIGLWRTYRNNRRDDVFLQRLPDHLWDVATTIAHVGDFFQRAVPFYKFEGPVPPVGHPWDPDALKTTVIRQIAQTCQKHFGTSLYSTVATLANASVGCHEINRVLVRASLRRTLLRKRRRRTVA
jgi:hypothetical protein